MTHASYGAAGISDHPGIGCPATPPGGHYVVSYHPGTVNHCPGCAGTHWFVGRESAQCAICETALPLAQMAHSPVRPLFVSRFTNMLDA